MSERELTHIAGTFVIQASGSFLNGAGLGVGEDRNVTIPKMFSEGRNRIPYVSAQAWKRWLRNTLVEETGWPASEIVAIGWNPKGNVKKISSELNPVDFVEDDIFGYMRTEKDIGRNQIEDELEQTEETTVRGTKTKAVMRASPFLASLLVSTRKYGVRGRDEAFVHITKFDPEALELANAEKDRKEPIERPCTPLPYTTEFYNTHLQSVFCLNYGRLGVFQNMGDRIELDETLAKRFLKDGKVTVIQDEGKVGQVYEMTNAGEARRERAKALLNALAVLRGGAKQAQFGTDISPKVIIAAGLNCGNPIFNHLFTDDESGIKLDVGTLKEVIRDYADRICTPVFIGVRSGFLRNEADVKALDSTRVDRNGSEVLIQVTTPIQAASNVGDLLP